MWWMIAQEAISTVSEDQDQAARVYQDATSFAMAQTSALSQMDDAQVKAAAIARDGAMSSVSINKAQRTAEAEAQVSASFAGVDGTAVDNVLRMTKTNAAYAQGAADIAQQSAFNAAVEDVYAAAFTYHSTRYEPPQSTIGKVLSGVTTLAYDFTDGEAWADSMAWM